MTELSTPGPQVVITGASSGIGAATASHFADQGCHVLNFSRRPCSDERVQSVEIDFSRTGSLESAAEAAGSSLSSDVPTVLVHNAARLVNDTIRNADPGTFRALLELNVTAPMLLTQALLPWLIPGSAVVFVGSTLSEKAVPQSLSYVTSKHALLGLMRSCTQDFAGSGIHSVAVCPGFTDTEMVRSHIPDNDLRLQIGGANGFGRLVEPREIAETIVFAARNPVLNGAVIHANLGQLET